MSYKHGWDVLGYVPTMNAANAARLPAHVAVVERAVVVGSGNSKHVRGDACRFWSVHSQPLPVARFDEQQKPVFFEK